IVLDASVVVSALWVRDERHEVSRAWLAGYLASGALLLAPSLILIEVAGVVARRTGDTVLGEEATAYFESIPVLELVDFDRQQSRLSARLAAELRLRGADTTTVALALERGVPLITWDKEQIERGGQRSEVRTPLAPMASSSE
ncbi:MAG TPA: type II toxin-antitoxin system VapC family toxin, partial [Herpetosiphonaceae bacterium]|nr:type II toxin-antitoxin system VapC family toxin [Herpetosiphonaceae bacterium]